MNLNPLRDELEAWWLAYFDAPMREVMNADPSFDRGAYIGFACGRLLAMMDQEFGVEQADGLIMLWRLSRREKE